MRILKSKIFICAACVVVSAFLAFVVIPKNAEKSKETTQIIRAATRIEENTLITENMLKIEEVGQYNLPSNVIKDKESIVGKYARTTILPQDNLLPEKFKTAASVDNEEFYRLDGYNTFAVSVTVKSLSAGLAAKLLPNDVVTIKAYHTEQKQLIDYPLLMYVKVLAVTNGKGEDIDKIKNKATDETSTIDIIPSSITLLVNQEQAQQLVEAENTCNIHVVLAGRGEIGQQLLGGIE